MTHMTHLRTWQEWVFLQSSLQSDLSSVALLVGRAHLSSGPLKQNAKSSLSHLYQVHTAAICGEHLDMPPRHYWGYSNSLSLSLRTAPRGEVLPVPTHCSDPQWACPAPPVWAWSKRQAESLLLRNDKTPERGMKNGTYLPHLMYVRVKSDVLTPISGSSSNMAGQLQCTGEAKWECNIITEEDPYNTWHAIISSRGPVKYTHASPDNVWAAMATSTLCPTPYVLYNGARPILSPH